MARNISISFSLTAALTGGFKGAFQSAASSARNVASAIREMEKSPVGHLGAAMAQQREKIKGLAGSLKEAKTTLATLQSQAQPSGGATGMLARQIELAQSRVNNLNGAMQRQLGIWRNTTAQAATTGGSIRRLANDYDHLSREIERARRVQAAMAANRAQADALRSQRADLNSRLTGAVAAATTVAAPVALSIGFEDQMAKVGAVSRAGKDDLAALTAQARQLGRDPSFSASQAAEGMQYLAMAGFKTNQVMAAMPGMLDLAAASGTDLGRTADIASNILSAFDLKAEQMGHVGDVLVAAFTSSNTTLESLGETMKYVGPVAKDAGASIEDAVAMAAMLGNVGISGSQAGTASKSIFARLAAPPTEAAKALNALNIQTKDAQGNLRAVPDILEEITLKTASMGTADRTDVFSKVFGLEPMAGASALAKQAAQTVDENGKQIVDSMGNPTTALLKFADDLKHASDNIDGTGGASARVAKQMNATTGGALRMLSSAWQDAGIEVGNLFLPAIQMAAGALSTIANVISATVNRFPMLSKGIALVVGGIIGLTAASVAMGLIMNFVRTGLNGFRCGLLRISAASLAATASTTASTAAAGGFGIASRIAGAGAKFFAGGLRSILMATGVGALLVGLGFAINLLIDNWDAVVAAMSAAWAWVTETWSRLGVFFSELGKNLGAVFSGWGETLTGWVKPVWNWITGVWSGISGFFGSLFDGVANIAGSVWGRIVSLVTSPVEAIKAGWNSIASFFSGLWNRAADTASSFGSGIVGFFRSAYQSILSVWNGITSFFSGLWNGIVSGVSVIAQGFLSVFTGVKNAVMLVWSGIKAFYSGLWNGIVSYYKAIWGIVTKVAAGVVAGVKAVWNGITGFFGAIWDGIISYYKTVWNIAVSVATALVGRVKAVWNGITSFFSGIWNGIVSGVSSIGQGILSVFSWAKNTVMTVWSGITGFFSGIANAITGVFSWTTNSITNIWSGLADFFTALWNWLSEKAANLWNNISSLATWAFDAVSGVWNGAVEFFSGIVNNISAAFAWAYDGIVCIWQGVVEFFGSIGQGISDCFSGVWQGIVDLASWAWEGIATVWTGVSEFFGGIVDSIFGVFTGLFDWLKEKFAWVFDTIDAVGSVISSITGAVKGAWNAAFGDDEKKDGGEKSAAPAADKAQKEADRKKAENVNAALSTATQKPASTAPAAQNALNTSKDASGNVPSTPKYQPVSANAYHAAFEGKKDGAKGGKKTSGGGSRSRSRASGSGGHSRSGAASGGESGTGAGSGPVTVVTLDSGNEIKTQFIPAAARNAKPLETERPNGFGENAAANANRIFPPKQPDRGFLTNAASALKSSGLGATIGQGLQAGIGMAKSVLGIGQKQETAAAQASKAQPVQTTILSAAPAKSTLAQTAQAVASGPTAGQVRNGSALQTAGQPALPQAPAMIARKQGQKAKEAQPGQQGISIDLTQNFDLITQDAAAARKVLEAIRPDMEALIRRALEKISSDRRRTSYAQ